jgi:hypothetical protein
MKLLFSDKYIKFIVIFLSISFIPVYFFYNFYFSCIFRTKGVYESFHGGEFTLKIETTNQTNQLVTAELVEQGLKKALLSTQLNPKHWAVDRVYITGIIGSGFANWNETVQVTNNNAKVILCLTNTVLKGGREPFVGGKRNMFYCDIGFSDKIMR